jgi:hypothetical protein
MRSRARVRIILQSKKYMYLHDSFISFRFLWRRARICYHTYCVNTYTIWRKSSPRNFIPVVRYRKLYIFLPCMNLNALIIFAVILIWMPLFQVVGSPEETSRLLLCEATLVVMRHCFYLLGIEPVYKLWTSSRSRGSFLE